MKTVPAPRKHNGFTLIELLVVIAIIAILASILFPVFARARENARRAACQSNMKQLGLGILQYEQDYDEHLPFVRTAAQGQDVANYADPGAEPNWIAQIYPYTKSWQILACPSAPQTTTAGYVPTGNDNTNYFANGVLFTTSGRHTASIPSSSDIIFLQENFERYSHTLNRPHDNWTVSIPTHIFYHFHQDVAGIGEILSYMHFSGGNLLYCDGHVKWRASSTLHASDYGLTGGAGATGSASDTPATTDADNYNAAF